MMKLTETERERITDSALKIQSVRASLDRVGKSKIPKREEVENCLDNVDHVFREALGYTRSDADYPPKAARKKTPAIE
jgi:hypothetical protein